MLSGGLHDIETSDAATAAMALAFEHYTIHKKILLRKLQHAQVATKKSFQEIGEWSEHHKMNAASKEFREKERKKYDELWKSAIELFQDSYVSDVALKKIEAVLSAIPKIIKKYYDALVNRDVALQKMLQKVASQKYQKALKLIKNVQSTSEKADDNSMKTSRNVHRYFPLGFATVKS